MQTGLRLASNFAVLSGAEFVSKAAAALTFAYLARVLGPDTFGQLEFALAIAFFFTLVVDTGLSAYGAREIARQPESWPRLVVHVSLLRGVLALGSFVVLVLAALAFSDQPPAVRALLVLYGVTLFGLPGMQAWLFQGREMMRFVALASVLRWTIFTVGVFAVVRAADEVWLVPTVECVALAGVTLFYLVMLVRRFGWPRVRIDTSFALATIRQSLPIGASELVWAIKVYSATVLMQLLVAGPQVGWYAAALRVIVSLHTFVWLYFFNLLPSLSRNASESRPTVRRIIEPSLQVTAWSAVFIGMVGMAIAGPLIQLLYGSDYAPAVGPLQLLIWVIPVTLLSGHYRYALIACGRQQLEFVTSAVGAVLNVGLNLVLIPQFGMAGAAWALMISEAAIWLLAYAFVHRSIAPISFLPALRLPALAGVLMLATLRLLPTAEGWLAVSAATVVYGVVLSITQPNIFGHARSLVAISRTYRANAGSS